MYISVPSTLYLSTVAWPQKHTCFVLILPLGGASDSCLALRLLDVTNRSKLSSSVIFLTYFSLHHATRPVGDSEAAARWHPSDQEGLPSPGGPIYSCGSQDGLSGNYHARLGETQLFLNYNQSLQRSVVSENAIAGGFCLKFFHLKWKFMHEYENKWINAWALGGLGLRLFEYLKLFFYLPPPPKVTYGMTSMWLWYRGILTKETRLRTKMWKWSCLFTRRTERNWRYGPEISTTNP